MKRVIGLLVAVALVLTVVMSTYAETSTIDISTLSIAELQTLRTQIDNRLLEMGAYYADIAKNEKGKPVENLQQRLIELGYLSGEVTGKWDSASQKALKAFENEANLVSDGIPSAADQTAVFSDTAIAKPTPSPSPTPAPSPTPDPRKAYGKYDYKAIFRNPENYIDNKVKVTGRAIQVLGSRTEGFTIRLATRGHYDNVIMLYIMPENAPTANVLEDDSLIVYGTVSDNYTYTSTMGAEITVPLVYADAVEIK